MEKSLYKKEKSKAVDGPGGMKCSCCHINPKSEAKKMDARIKRHRNKFTMRQVLSLLYLGEI